MKKKSERLLIIRFFENPPFYFVVVKNACFLYICHFGLSALVRWFSSAFDLKQSQEKAKSKTSETKRKDMATQDGKSEEVGEEGWGVRHGN